MAMTEEERADPRHHPENYTRWNSFFLRRCKRELASYAQQRRGSPALVERAG